MSLKVDFLNMLLHRQRLHLQDYSDHYELEAEGSALRDSNIAANGPAITKILPPVSKFSKDNGHSAKKRTVLERLTAFFERFFGLT